MPVGPSPKRQHGALADHPTSTQDEACRDGPPHSTALDEPRDPRLQQSNRRSERGKNEEREKQGADDPPSRHFRKRDRKHFKNELRPPGGIEAVMKHQRKNGHRREQ